MLGECVEFSSSAFVFRHTGGRWGQFWIVLPEKSQGSVMLDMTMKGWTCTVSFI